MDATLQLTRSERCTLSYYNNASILRGIRAVLRPLYVAASFCLILKHVETQDGIWAVAGYGLLLYRLLWCFLRSNRSLKLSVKAANKYRARISELEHDLARMSERTSH